MDEKYQELMQFYNKRLEKNKKDYNFIANVNLLLFILMVTGLFYSPTPEVKYIFLGISACLFIVLITMWIVQYNIKKTMKYCKGMININQNYINRINGEFFKFEDIGEEFIDNNHPYSSDLDIVGKKSLFQMINSTNTWHGRQEFVRNLLYPDFNKKEIFKRQKAIDELSKKTTLSHDFQYTAQEIPNDKSIVSLVEVLKDNSPFLNSKLLTKILLYVPILVGSFCFLVLIFSIKSLYVASIVLLVLQLIIWRIGNSKTNNYLGATNSKYKLDNFTALLTILQNEKFESEKLMEIQNKLLNSEFSAYKAMKQLDTIMDMLSLNSNPITAVFFNVFFLWNFGCAFALEKWKNKYSSVSEQWFLSIGEFESLLSFSNISNVVEKTCTINILSDAKKISVVNMGHPLISNDNRIYNDFCIDSEISIVSGSNMSGKTTFLRTIGINLILGKNGCPVCAEKMEMALLDVITSMRIADDLGNGISTFYAELKRIKNILDMANKNINTIFLIDEIFRGTNSVDRLLGAKTVIMKLNSLKILGLITTHDLELCQLESNKNIINYNFSEHYENNKIIFDYKIKTGISKTTNGKFLMEMVGILS